jgi:peptidoglycan/LPS O-acetylase OafA/YrhL
VQSQRWLAGHELSAISVKTQSIPLSPAEPLQHVPALDGLRAAAVTLVLLYHADVPWMQGGFLGVSVFFTLSGFLITALLLREWWSSSALGSANFWFRRLKRLTPAAWTVIAGVLAFGVFGLWDNSQLRDLRSDVPWSMAELVNWHFISAGKSYGDAFSAPSPLEHFWSLAVETQFYALLILLVTAVLTRGKQRFRRLRLNRLILALLIATALSATANFVLARDSIDRAYFGTDTRAAEMLIGALLACVTLRHLQLPGVAHRRLLAIAGPCAAAVIVLLSSNARLDSAWLYPWGLLGTACCTALVLAAVLQGGFLGRLLQLKALVALGRISYGVYLIHWPIFLVLTPQRTGLSLWPLFLLRMALVIPLALLLFQFVEQPIRTRSFRLPRRAALGASFAAGLILVSAIALTSNLPSAPAFLQQRALGSISTSRPTAETPENAVASGTATQEASRSPLRVLLVGDSVAASLQDALAQSLTARGITFASVAAPGCGVIVGVPGSSKDTPIKMLGNVMVAECENTIPQRQSESVAQFKPDLVISLSTWEAIDRTVNGVWYKFGTPDSDTMLKQLFADTHARLTAGGATLAWVLMPDTVPAANTPPGRPNPQDLKATSHLRNLLSQYQTEQANTTVLDLASIACPALPCPTEVDGITLRPTDGLHFEGPNSATFVADQMSAMIAQLDLNQLANP